MLFVFSKTKMYLSITNLNEIAKPLLNKTMEIHLPKDSWIGKLLVDELRGSTFSDGGI